MDEQTILIADGDHHSYTLGRMCARGFASLAQEVRYVGTDTHTIPFWGKNVGVGRMRQRFIKAVARTDPDVVFVIKGQNLPRSTIQEARAMSDACFCNWNPDNPFMTRSSERTLDTYLDALPEYDVCFIWSEELFPDLYDRGSQHVEHLAFGFDPTVHYPAPVKDEYEADVAFVGHTSQKRMCYIKALTELDVDVAIYGDYWKRPSVPPRIREHVRDGTVYGEDYNRAFCSADVVVNVVSDHNLEAYNMRTFEIPATDSFMLTTDTKCQRSIFPADECAAYFDSRETLKRKVRYYLTNDDERETIAAAGSTAVSGRSYENRMQTVLETINDL